MSERAVTNDRLQGATLSSGCSSRNNQGTTQAHPEANLPLIQRNWLIKPNFRTTEPKNGFIKGPFKTKPKVASSLHYIA